MSRSYLAAVLFGAFVVFLAGCAPRAGRPAGSQSAQHLIFNPECSAVTLEAIGRSEWPSTIAQTQFGEDIWYEETVVDWQGRFDRSTAHDYYRRFAAQRTGRARR